MYCKNCGAEMNDVQDVCLKCGVRKGNGTAYCQNCGSQVLSGAEFCLGCGVQINQKNYTNNACAATVSKRGIVKAIILSFITCGIYFLFWFVSMTDDMNKLTGSNDTSGGTCLLLTFITCGIYGYYWAYKMGEKKEKLTGQKDSSGIIYLVLMLFGFGVVVYAFIQDAINKAVDQAFPKV